MIARYLLAWMLLMPIGVLNGTVRQLTYGKIIPELQAHQLATFIGIILFAAYAWAVDRKWPLQSASQALMVGGIWLLLTIVFELTFDRLVTRLPWEGLLRDYNLAAGRYWVLVLAAVTLLPFAVFKLRS